jgi:hypothetical protein
VRRGSYLPLFLVFILFLISISQGFRLRRSFLPLRHPSHSGGTLKPHPLHPCLLPFIVGMVGTSLGKVTPYGVLHTYP